jgi:hypothetical protein
MKARAVMTSTYKRYLDPIFGKVESFRPVKEHRVQIQVGRLFFTSNATYSSAENAKAAAARMEAKDSRP